MSVTFEIGDTVVVNCVVDSRYNGVVYRKWVNTLSGDISSIEVYIPERDCEVGEYWKGSLRHGRILLTEKGFYCEKLY